ncbi:MAG: DUF4230 domain-containing protein [Cyclobacteriaceae bacterium]|nr:DUF4230 domain-containing protein [Cyclobacteriaceae bacterium]UYN86585.1 MAG: DUF4230 domain-containing protein [Cyclobacteriaceae bacterium]
MISRYLKLAIVLIAVGTLAAYVLLVIIPRQTYTTAKAIGKDFREAFQFTPEVKVRNTIVLQQQTAILELAALSQKFQHHYNWKNSWMGSTKQIEISGSFEAKCGFDLNKKFSIVLENDKAIIYLPAPKILSLEPMADLTFRDENGYWNWVNENDRTNAVNAFITDARNFAEQASFIEDTKKVTEEKLRDLLKNHVKEVLFVYEAVIVLPVH